MHAAMMHDLSSYAVGQQQLPTLHYIPDFISAAEEQRLLGEVHASKAKWVQVCGRTSSRVRMQHKPHTH